MFDFNVLKFFSINTCIGKVLRHLPVLDESFLHQVGLKLTLMGLLGVIQVLPFVEVFFVGV